jgi:hypothetical protein
MSATPHLGQSLADALLAMQQKRKSRVWFGDDVDYLNALCEAEKAVQAVISYLVRERVEEETVVE